ncbi:MAG: sulfatase, partial [bacterium]|nr:sulfatase [bacterium]
MFSRRDFIKALSAGAAAAALGGLNLRRAAAQAAGAGGAGKMPNVIFILADDLGWRDTGVFGSSFYRTPNVDALAKRAMMFTDAYAANPLCSPTRASVMTGLWPARTGITAPACHVPEVKLEPTLPKKGNPAYKAIGTVSATRLKQEYFTLAEALKAAGYRTGHFGKWHLGMEPYDPLHQGFDVDVPHWWGPGPAKTYVAPWAFPAELKFTGAPGEHLEDRMAQEAVKFLRENKDRPFFLNYWAFSVHAPFDAKKALIEKYRGMVDPANPQRNPMMAAMIESMDDAIGTLTKTLDELGLTDNTIIFFTGDNGGNMYDRVEGLPPTNNWPLRGGKANIHEGGTREPLLVVWPGVVNGGTQCHQVVQSVDYYPTILDMLGLKPQAGQKFDGISIVPALKGEKLGREAIFCLFPHNTPATGERPSAYVRRGDWKLIRFFYEGEKQADGAFAHRYELYNLKYDLGEHNNLAEANPEMVKELDALIEGFLKDSGALLPSQNPDYDPVKAAEVPDQEQINM